MINKLFKQLLISQIVSAMAVTLCLLVDSIMIGRFLGVDAVAAYGLANPVLLGFAAFGSLLSSGIQVVCSKAMGNGNDKQLNTYFTVAVTVAAVFSAVGVALVLIFLDPLCVLLGAKEGTPVFTLTKDYLKGFIIGAPAFIAAQMLVPFLQMSGERIRLVVAVLCMTVADIAFDLLNVYIFKQDTFGMGLASTVSYYIAIIIGGIYFFSHKCIYKFDKKLIKLKALLEVFSGGIPTVINQISLVLLVFTVNKVMMSAGQNTAVAAFSIVSTIANLGYCIGGGISEVSLMLTSISYTEEDEHSLKEIVKVQSVYAIFINLAATLIFVVFATPLVRLFIDSSPDAENDAIFGLRMFAVSLIPSSLNAAFKKYYQAIGNILFSEIFSALQNFVFPATVVLILGNTVGKNGVWWYYLIGEVLSLLFITIYVHIKSGKPMFSLDSYVFLPEDFGAKPGDAMEFSVFDASGITSASLAAQEFCRIKGLPKKKSMYTALCIEEMANNIIQHGFVEGKDNRIDIRLVKKENHMLIRIRDNCKHFDPTKYMELNRQDSSDLSKHIGIRMTYKMVKKVQYVNSLGLNSLMLDI
ncbi:MAG: ATP-binding protein [Lachnospiraceae bacterium]|nr:ATP-binding protein [Lachnospiraceae bacterium]